MPKSKPQGIAASIRAAQKTPQGENDIFALDIGTRNVVGVIGHLDDGVFVVTDSVSVSHKRRAMLDGQIEDIGETARVVRQVKDALEDKSGIILSRVAIAAAGRALKTRRACIETELDGKESISENMLKSFELEAVSKAQSELDRDAEEENINFYCVGHTVIRYTLDDYPIKSLVGHKGKKVSIELIAAFLPSLVVESLYTVMDMNGLDVCSLTLEPIAAMNVIIPPEVRLINIALVDIGAGTTDIAISQNGSIVAYAMATIAGDEITEEIIQKYLVDFETAEMMKLSPTDKDLVFKDILGFEHTVTPQEFFGSLFPAEEQLANTIASNILEANGAPPAAVFLVGGGSLIPELASLVAEKLNIPENRVAIGGQSYNKNINLGKVKITGPEFVTPIGIGITATLQKGYEFSSVVLNGSKIRVFDTKAVTLADLLINAGFKTSQIIGKSGRGLTFTLNGEKQSLRGETSNPAQILVNGLPATLEYTVKQGDIIEFTPATIGMNAAVTISDIAGDVFARKLFIDSDQFVFGRIARINGNVVSGSYSIQNYDSIDIETIETLGDLMGTLPFDCSKLLFYKGDRLLHLDYILEENDSLTTKDRKGAPDTPNAAREIAIKDEKASRTVKMLSSISMGVPEGTDTQAAATAASAAAATAATATAPEAAPIPAPAPAAPAPAPAPAPAVDTITIPMGDITRESVASAATASTAGIPAPAPSTLAAAAAAKRTAPTNGVTPDQLRLAGFEPEAPETAEPEEPPHPTGSIVVFLNDKATRLAPRSDKAPHEFLELMSLADIDIDNPPSSGKMVLTLNGRDASFMDLLRDGDQIVIRWDA